MTRHRTRTFTTILTGVVLILGLTAPGATAAQDDTARLGGGHIEGPHPAPAAPFDLAAGEACAFPVHVEPIVDEIQAIDYYDASGRLVKSLFYGTLVDDVTNTETGATTTVDLSGTALFAYGADGSLTIYGVGPYLVVFRDGDLDGPGVLRIDGISKVVIGADGTRQIVYASSVENLCERID